MFNGTRLTIARQRRQLTKKKLAEMVCLSPVTLTRLESSLNEPEPETVVALASALGFPKDFFHQDDLDTFSVEAASFRSMKTVTARERDAALAAGSIAFALADWFHERFKLPDVDLIDLSAEQDCATASRSLRQYWRLGEKPIPNMIQLLEAKGVRVFSLAENSRKVDAFSCWRSGVPYVFLNMNKTAEHSRFDAAHELGHLVLHKHAGTRGSKSVEEDANAFAAALLMPRADVISRLPRALSIDELIRKKSRWKVSLIALIRRLHKLGIITDWQYRSYAIEVTTRYGKAEPESIERERSLVWQKALQSLWQEKITKTQIGKDLCVPVEEIDSLLFGLVN